MMQESTLDTPSHAVPASSRPRRRALSRRNVAAWGAVLVLCLGLAWLAYLWAERLTIEKLRVNGAQRLEVYATSLENLLDKYDFLPRTLEPNKDVIALLEHPTDKARQDSVSEFLERLNRQARSTTIYVSDMHGVTRAASNWLEPGSFIGDNVSFRPYVRDALRGTPGGFYGVGTTQREPGYFFAHGIFHQGEMLGVATVKVNIEQLERTWVQGNDKVLLCDENGVVFLTSVPAWKYHTLEPLPLEAREHLAATRQYYSYPLTPLKITYDKALDNDVRIVALGAPSAQAGGNAAMTPRMLSQSRSLAPRNWKFIYLSDLSLAHSNAQAAFLFSCLLQAFLVMLFLYLRQRQRNLRQRLRAREELQNAYDNLELMVAERTYSLKLVTHNLSEEIAIRRMAEDKLRVTQNELVQAGKMAVLGQMSAGITHELNQPLTALRTMSDNAMTLLNRGRLDEAKANLGIISQIVERMGAVTGQLKGFARKSGGEPAPVSVQAAIASALFLVERRVERERVNFRLVVRHADAHVLCDGNKLEQVLVNLFNNALDAMAKASTRQLTVTIDRHRDRIVIQVADTGEGLSDAVREHLFEPFFTTKAQGQGLGLGLSISEQIVVEFGGILRAEPAPGGGAQFVIELRISGQETGNE